MQNKKGNKNMEPVPKLKKRNSGTGSKINNKAFTLIELLVVITILAILATIGFLSFQSYNVFARDSVRLWNLKTLESSLWIQYVQSWNYALPDDSVNITASWTIIRKQWVFWKNALRTVWVSKNWSTDPLTQEYFDYSVWNNLQEYQLVAYLEWDEAMVSPHLASPKGRGILWNSYANIWQMKSMWEDLWIVFSWWIEVHKISPQPAEVDIREDNKEYTVKFSEWDEITSSWSLLFSSIYNHSKNLLKNKELAKLDDSLVLYFDMETTTQSWSEVVLKDLSKYWNNWKLMWWIKIWTEVWINWKWTYFDWINDFIDLVDKNIAVSWNGSRSINISLWLIQDNWFPWKVIFSSWFPSNKNTYNLRVFDSDRSFKFNIMWYSYDNATSNSKLNDGKKSFNISTSYDWQNQKLFINWWNEWESLQDYNTTGQNNYIWKSNHVWAEWYFKWTIDEVRIYNRALSEEEIKNVYGSTLK